MWFLWALRNFWRFTLHHITNLNDLRSSSLFVILLEPAQLLPMDCLIASFDQLDCDPVLLRGLMLLGEVGGRSSSTRDSLADDEMAVSVLACVRWVGRPILGRLFV